MKSPSITKTPPTDVSSCREELKTLDSLVRRAAPSLKPYARSGMLGYGKFHYSYPSGREGDCPKIALARRKNYISLYVCALDGGRYLAEGFKDRLPKASVGKSCVRFKRLADVDLKVLEEMVRLAEKAPAPGAVE